MACRVSVDGRATANWLGDAPGLRLWPYCLEGRDGGAEGWAGWHWVARGTRVVVWSISGPLESWGVPDGCGEVVFLRVKWERQGAMTYANPVFGPVAGGSKSSDKLLGRFAFADDEVGVAELRRSVAWHRGEQAMAALFNSFAVGQKKEAMRVEAARRREERESELARIAASVGVTLDELKRGMALWDRLRRGRYPVGSCLLCGRTLTDPASIVSGVGPECIQQLPQLRAAVAAKVVDVGRLRWSAEQLVARFERVGAEDLAAVVRGGCGV